MAPVLTPTAPPVSEGVSFFSVSVLNFLVFADKFPSSVPGAGGVGDLPDTASETSLPVLFEERHLHDTTSTKSTGITAGGVGAITTGGVGDLPGTKSESSVAKLPEERLHEKTPIAETSKVSTIRDLIRAQ